MLFSQIIGLNETKQALIASVKGNHVAHAQLFLGNEGSANLALALAYAQYINCEEREEKDACGRCANCIQYNKLVHPDLNLIFPLTSLEKVGKEELKPHLLKSFRSFVLQNPYSNLHEWGKFVGAENKQFNIPVDEGREIIRSVSLKAYQAEYKVVVVWLPELMHISTANALLKVLEEPPAKTLFFLVANDHERLLSTIISRCQMVKIRAFNEAETSEYLLQNNLCDEKRASRLAKIAEGNLLKAAMLAAETEDDSHTVFVDWMRLCFSRKYDALLLFCEELGKKGRENQKSLLQYSLQTLRDALMNKLDVVELIRQDTEELKFIQNFSKTLKEELVSYMYKELNEAYQHIERNGNAKIVFFDTSIQIGKLFQKN